MENIDFSDFSIVSKDNQFIPIEKLQSNDLK
jgi:hypothetical protein